MLAMKREIMAVTPNEAKSAFLAEFTIKPYCGTDNIGAVVLWLKQNPGIRFCFPPHPLSEFLTYQYPNVSFRKTK